MSAAHLIVTTKTEAVAQRIASLNPGRARIAPQQEAAATYRWPLERALEYLGHLQEARCLPGGDAEQFPSECSIPEVYGKWNPLLIREYLDFGVKPSVPGEGRASSAKTWNTFVSFLSSAIFFVLVRSFW